MDLEMPVLKLHKNKDLECVNRSRSRISGQEQPAANMTGESVIISGGPKSQRSELGNTQNEFALAKDAVTITSDNN